MLIAIITWYHSSFPIACIVFRTHIYMYMRLTCLVMYNNLYAIKDVCPAQIKNENVCFNYCISYGK